jgi:biotin carboxylase
MTENKTKFHSKRLLMLGAGVMQGPAINLAREMGVKTLVVDGNPNAPLAAAADRFERVDLKDKEGIEALARSVKETDGLDGVMTAGTDFSATVAWVAEKLALPGIPYEAALNASDKARMRSCFKQAGIPSPRFLTLNSLPEPGFVLPFAFPVVVKPVDNMGGRGCRRVDSMEELFSAMPEALKFSRSGRAIVEEFMEGPEFSVDALVYKNEITICGFADRHIYFPPYFIEMGHTMPSIEDSRNYNAMIKTFSEAVEALGITAGVGAAKGDIKFTPQGPMIGEIAARLSGGYMSGWTYPYASGVEVTQGAIRLALGEGPGDLEARRNWTSAERAFISIPGKVRSIEGLEKARATDQVKDLFLRVEPGSVVNFPENNVTKCGNVISAAPSREAAVNGAEKAVREVFIRLEPSNSDTENFLFAKTAPSLYGRKFPPDAFQLSPALQTQLDALPDPAPTPIPAHKDQIAILPFPAFTESALKDYVGRTVEESLQVARDLTGLPLPIAGENSRTGLILGRRFWAALIRGGYQGAVYLVDSLLPGLVTWNR